MISFPSEYVFPQTPAEDENFNRTGGLTKRELFAAMLVRDEPTGYRAPSRIAMDAVSLADALIYELERVR